MSVLNEDWLEQVEIISGQGGVFILHFHSCTVYTSVSLIVLKVKIVRCVRNVVACSVWNNKCNDFRTNEPLETDALHKLTANCGLSPNDPIDAWTLQAELPALVSKILLAFYDEAKSVHCFVFLFERSELTEQGLN